MYACTFTLSHGLRVNSNTQPTCQMREQSLFCLFVAITAKKRERSFLSTFQAFPFLFSSKTHGTTYMHTSTFRVDKSFGRSWNLVAAIAPSAVVVDVDDSVARLLLYAYFKTNLFLEREK